MPNTRCLLHNFVPSCLFLNRGIIFQANNFIYMETGKTVTGKIGYAFLSFYKFKEKSSVALLIT